jgi:hypothetical protein
LSTIMLPLKHNDVVKRRGILWAVKDKLGSW